MPIRTLTLERRSTLRAQGLWQDRSLAEIVAQSPSPDDAPAVSDRYGAMTYGDLRAAVRRVASWVTATTEPQEVVAIQTRGTGDVLLLHLACSLTDRVAMPLSHAFTVEETDHLLTLSGAAVLVAADPADLHDPRTAADLHERHPRLRVVASENGTLADADVDFRAIVSGEHAVAEPDAWPPAEPDAPHLAMISSGTTSMPKVSLWTDNDLWFLLHQYAAHVDLGPGDVALQVAPPNTGSTGYVFPVLAPVLHEARSVMLPRWSPAAALDAIAEHGVTVATAVPTQMVKMVQEQQREARDVATLRAFTNAGAKLEEEHARRVEATLGCRVQASFGASDGGVPVLTSVHDSDHHRLRSVGRTLPGVDLRLVDAEGRLVTAVATPGEIRWRTPSKTFGYLHNPDQEAVAFDEEGFYCSGDLGVLDADGYLFVVGRSRDMIIRGGMNIHPGEIEEAALTHPSVVEIAALGVPDEVYGERTAAVAVVRSGTTLELDELCAWLRDRGLATHKLPERLVVLPDLPRNTGGKVDKLALRAHLVAAG
jgi:non-ribosomal peptide synthetase component E (peptide arylation enzyme)